MKVAFPKLSILLCPDNSDWTKWQCQLNASPLGYGLNDLRRFLTSESMLDSSFLNLGVLKIESSKLYLSL